MTHASHIISTTTTSIKKTSPSVSSSVTVFSPHTSASCDDSSTLVSLNIKIFLDNNFPAFKFISVHFLNCLLCQLDGIELHDPSTSRFATLVIKELNIGHFSNFFPEQILHLLPLHFER